MNKTILKITAGALLSLSVSLTAPAFIQPSYAYPNGQYLNIDGNVVQSGETVHVVLCQENISLREACVRLGFLTPERFDEVFHPEQMI